MQNHFPNSGHPKKATWRILIWRMALRIDYLPSGHLILRLWWSQWSYFCRCRKAIRTHFLETGHQKRDLDEFAVSMFHVGKSPWEFIISLVLVLICFCGEVDEAMYQGTERPCELFFWIVGEKNALGRRMEMIFQVGEWPREIIICHCTSQIATCWCKLRDVSRSC
jgi:hypothetical protein